MTYVISDLHGYPLEKFKMLLEKANFCDDDFLYILGDVVDRNGDGGVEMLQWLMQQYNIQLILGNHEAMLLSCDFLFDEITDETISTFDADKIERLSLYQYNGGDVTLKALSELDKRSPQAVAEIIDYLRDVPLYDAISVEGRDYFLAHSGIRNFEKGKKISEYSPDDLLWERPQLNDEYFDDITTIFGHTPTLYYGNEYKGSIITTDTWINIDVGAGYGIEPVLLRLDDMQEFRN